MTHSTVTDSTGRGLASDFIEVAAEVNALESLVAILCDGTGTNVGWRLGLFVHVERELQRRLLLLSCTLHANELPLRHLFTHCDGGHGTSGPDSFKGPIGQACATEVHLMDVVHFVAVESPLRDIEDQVVEDLSRDQLLLYKYVKAVAGGVVPRSLLTQKIGGLNHSRWLTLGIRILALYTRTSEPSAGLCSLVEYIQTVYAPIWFEIKSKPNFVNGPPTLFLQMKLVMKLKPEVRDIVQPVIQRNGWMAEPGIMLCAMLSSKDKVVREKGVKLILQRRRKPLPKPRAKILCGIRKIEVPSLQWAAPSWEEIIDWKVTKYWEPAIIEKFTKDDLENTKNSPVIFPTFPQHSQTVERAVKLVSDASSQV